MTDDAILEVKDLQISFSQEDAIVQAVKGISFQLKRGRFTGIVGESGSGKSVTALSLLGLLPVNAQVQGKIQLRLPGEPETNLQTANATQIREIRGNKIAMIFQEPMTSLNPVLTCGYQVMESLMLHKKIGKREARLQTIELFRQVELPSPETIVNRYPHEISGGQKQRVMIAIAISCQPDLLIADEPTTALDVRVQRSILELIKKLQQDNNMAVLLITHDLALISSFADEVIVMRHGAIVEQGKAATILHDPNHPYTKALLSCRPKPSNKGFELPVVEDFFQEKETTVSPGTKKPVTQPQKGEVMLEVKNLEVAYAGKKSWLGKSSPVFKAVNDVSFSVFENEIVGLVGESGCGKTTLGRAILQLVKPTAGEILLRGKKLSGLPPKELRQNRKDLQIVFQDPYGSLNPRISIGDAILEPLKVHHLHQKSERKEKVIELLSQVNIPADAYRRYPHQFSGGQRQRICIARALALEPSFLIFDESVSALDVSVQAQVLNLLQDLKNQYHFTAIFISHDLSVVHYISDRILVMNKGKIVESGTADEVMYSPKQTYTRELIEAAEFGSL